MPLSLHQQSALFDRSGVPLSCDGFPEGVLVLALVFVLDIAVFGDSWLVWSLTLDREMARILFAF